MSLLIESQTPPKTLQVFSDGACWPHNPGGYACWGWAALQDGAVVAQAYGCLGHGPEMSNNVAEYHGVIEALRWLQSQQHAGITLTLTACLS